MSEVTLQRVRRKNHGDWRSRGHTEVKIEGWRREIHATLLPFPVSALSLSEDPIRKGSPEIPLNSSSVPVDFGNESAPRKFHGQIS